MAEIQTLEIYQRDYEFGPQHLKCSRWENEGNISYSSTGIPLSWKAAQESSKYIFFLRAYCDNTSPFLPVGSIFSWFLKFQNFPPKNLITELFISFFLLIPHSQFAAACIKKVVLAESCFPWTGFHFNINKWNTVFKKTRICSCTAPWYRLLHQCWSQISFYGNHTSYAFALVQGYFNLFKDDSIYFSTGIQYKLSILIAKMTICPKCSCYGKSYSFKALFPLPA